MLGYSSYSQQDDLYDHGLNESKWEDIRDGIRYEGREGSSGRQWTYESDQEYQNDRLKNGENGPKNFDGPNGNGPGDGPTEYSNEKESDPIRAERPRGNMPSFSGLGVIGYVLLVIFAILLIGLIYYFFINMESKGKKLGQASIELEELNPVEIPLSELQRLLQEALAKNDFRAAVRIYFIFIIRDLAQKNRIKWEKEKTNFHYLTEMSGQEDYDLFNKSVSYFEVIWYGKRDLDASKFNQIQPIFKQFLDKLGVK